MAVGDLVVQDWQAEWDGVLFDGATEDSPIQIVSVEGLADMPELTTADRERLRRHGTIPGDDFLGPRSTTWTLRVEGDDDDTTRAACDALRGATIPGRDESPLVFQIPGVAGARKCRMMARCRRRSIPMEQLYRVGIVEAVLEFTATDPRLYGEDQRVETSSLPSAGGGLDVPAAVPFVIGTATTGGSIFAVNDGTFDTPLTARIDGPADNPRIIDVTNDRAIQFDLSLAAGEWLEIDTEARTVMLNGTTSRYYSIATGSEWFDLGKGTTEITFRASTSTAATLTLTWRSAWV